MKRITAAVAACTVALSIGVGVSPALAATGEIDEDGAVWTYGDRIWGTEKCWGRGAKPLLQVKRSGSWATVAKGKLRQTSECPKKFPYEAYYIFRLSDLGQKDPVGRTYTLEVRSGMSAEWHPFTRTVYASTADFLADRGDAVSNMLQ